MIISLIESKCLLVTEKERENTQKGRKVLVTDKVNAFIDTFA